MGSGCAELTVSTNKELIIAVEKFCFVKLPSAYKSYVYHFTIRCISFERNICDSWLECEVSGFLVFLHIQMGIILS